MKLLFIAVLAMFPMTLPFLTTAVTVHMVSDYLKSDTVIVDPDDAYDQCRSVFIREHPDCFSAGAQVCLDEISKVCALSQVDN